MPGIDMVWLTPSLPKPTRPTSLAHTGAWRMLSAAPASWLRVQNLAFTDAHVSAIYDWDSVALVPEPALVGSASVMHPIDGRLERPDPLPTLAQLARRLRGSTRCAVQRPRARRPRRGPTMDRQLRRPLPALRRPTRHLPLRRSVAGLAPHPPRISGSVRPGRRTVALRRPQCRTRCPTSRSSRRPLSRPR